MMQVPSETRLKKMKWLPCSARQRPARGGQLFGRKIETRLNEALVVKYDATIEPAGVSGHHEHVSDVSLPGPTGLGSRHVKLYRHTASLLPDSARSR